jgi:hypothetical protein
MGSIMEQRIRGEKFSPPRGLPRNDRLLHHKNPGSTVRLARPRAVARFLSDTEAGAPTGWHVEKKLFRRKKPGPQKGFQKKAP